MSHYCHVKICIRSRCQGNELEIFNLFQFIILSHKPWLNAIVESCSQLKIKNFLQDACGCSHGKNGSPCSRQFSEALILAILRNCMELSQLDLVILANIQAFTYVQVSGEKWKRSHWSAFTFQARPICKEIFLRLYGISYSLVRRLKDHYEDNGISLRVHGNHGRLPPNATSQTVNEEVKNFLTNYVEENAVFPGRIPGFKKEDLKLLSSSETQMSLWRQFKKGCSLLHKIYSSVGAVSSKRCCGKTHVWPLFNMSTKHFQISEIRQPTWQGKIRMGSG